MAEKEYKIRPIGVIRVNAEGIFLEIEEACRPAMKDLGTFSHVHVIWWFHLLDDEESRSILQVSPPYRRVQSQMGVFATRSPVRPNPIALTTVRMLHIDYDGGIIQIDHIEAEDGTPLVDLKPYIPSNDRVREVSTPNWTAAWPQWYEDAAHFDWEKERG